MRLTLGYVESLRGPSPSQTHRILSRTTGPARDIPLACGMRRPPESSAGAPRMKAVILAAGEGARMGPFTASVPKVMIPVGNRPLLEYVVQALVDNGIRDLIFIVGYRRERIQSHFQDGKAFGAHITYVTQTKQLGTAHAIWEARAHLEDSFVVLNGSNMVDGRFVGDLLRLNAAALKGLHEIRSGTIETAVTIRGRVSIGDGCVIRSGAYLQGPLSIGSGSEIGPNAVLLPSTSLGRNVRIGALTTVANSILMDDVILGPASVVQDSVIGSGVVARAGFLAASGPGDVNIEGPSPSVPQLRALPGDAD